MSTRCEHHLDNGLTLLIEELDRPAAATHLLLPGGSGVDPAGLEGAGALLGSLLQRGAGQRSTRELSEAFDGLGYRRAVSTGQSATVVTFPPR